MNCLETQKRMRAFLDSKLPDSEMEEFAAHVESCPDCREELEIYYAFDQTFEDKADGLSKEWANEKDAVGSLLRNASRKGRMMRVFRRVRYGFFIYGIVIVAIVILFWILRYIPDTNLEFERWGRLREDRAKMTAMQVNEGEIVLTEESEESEESSEVGSDVASQ